MMEQSEKESKSAIWQLTKAINEFDFLFNNGGDYHEMLVEIIRHQAAIIDSLQTRLAALEVFTDMVAPAPLPSDGRQWDEPSAEEVKDYWAGQTTFNGAVDYGDGPENPQPLEEIL